MSSNVPRSDADAYGLANLPPAHEPSASSPVAPSPGEPAAPDPGPLPEAAEAVEAVATTAPDTAKADADTDAPAPPGAAKPKRRKRRRGGFIWQWDAPSWGVSLMVHTAVIVVLALMAVGGGVDPTLESIDASTVDTSLSEQMAEELVTIYADPSEAEREFAVGDPTSTLSPGAAPSAMPPIRSATAEVSESRSLEGLVAVAVPSPSTSILPPTAMLNRDLSGGNRISGDVGRPTDDIGDALDQLAREILAHLNTSRVTVLWMFDESGSMKDDQRTVRDKFDRVIGELNLRVPSSRREAGDLDHAIVGFGQAIHFEPSPPRADLEEIRQAIESLPVDQTGEERTMQALVGTIGRYGRAVDKDRKILLVLVTDESGDDGDLVEQARLAMVNRGVTVYVLGRQAMFGYDTVRLRYVDPVTKDVYWPRIRRGPEAAGLELLQWDGLHRDRWDEQPSGFAPYELARLVEETGGIYFLLPNEEELRNRPRGEKAYPFATLKEYVPDYGPRAEYAARVAQNDLRRSMTEVIQLTKGNFGFRQHYPVSPPELAKAITEEVPKVDVQLRAMLEFERRLRAMEPARDKEASRRWQANYDLMLGLVVAYQIKAYEYRACLQEMATLAGQGRLVPKKPPIPNVRRTDWQINHSRDQKAPASETRKKYAEATRLLTLVIDRHPDTPWADLAQHTLDRGLGCGWAEWNVHPDYDKRAKSVPKY